MTGKTVKKTCTDQEDIVTTENLGGTEIKGNANLKNPDLIPAIIQDWKTGEVLMLAYMSSESFKKSLDTKTTWFWSRSRKELWNKGSTSGNKQVIKEIRYDCDSDALLLKVEQKGVACHTGQRSCFFNIVEDKDINKAQEQKSLPLADKLKFADSGGMASNVLQELYEVIIERLQQKNGQSYTYKLHKMGIDEILKKLGEESIEIILSAKHQTKKRIISEISDLLYHLLVLMAEKKIKLEDIYAELESRKK